LASDTRVTTQQQSWLVAGTWRWVCFEM